MKELTSIENHFNGNNFQINWNSLEDWMDAMSKAKEKRIIHWSVLVHVYTGLPFMRYTSWGGISKLESHDVPF